MTDPLVAMVEQARKELISRYGNFQGVLKHLQELERQRADKVGNRKKRGKKPKGAASRVASR